jgi:hypothetical protein
MARVKDQKPEGAASRSEAPGAKASADKSGDLDKKFYRTLNPTDPLPADDKRYVDWSAERGSSMLIQSMAKTISWSDEPTCQLISGHRGCGKTTELYRLRDALEKTDKGYFVVYCESDRYLDINDIDHIDVLLAMVHQLGIDTAARGLKWQPGRFKAFWEELKEILTTPVELKKVKVEGGPLGFEFDLKKNAYNRERVREHLRPQASTLLEAVNEVIKSVQNSLTGKWAGLVIIVDNLDRVFRQQISGTTRTTHDALFVDASDFLRGVNCHVIYTAPPALLYSLNSAKLAALFGLPPHVLPMVPTTTRAGAPHPKGLSKMKEVITRRLDVLDVENADRVISADGIDRLCAASGGYVRNLLVLARSALYNAEKLPVTIDAVEKAIKDVRDMLIRAIKKPQQWQVLSDVAQKKATTETEDFLQLLDNLLVLEYRDDDGPWYDVNPLTREVREFKG